MCVPLLRASCRCATSCVSRSGGSRWVSATCVRARLAASTLAARAPRRLGCQPPIGRPRAHYRRAAWPSTTWRGAGRFSRSRRRAPFGGAGLGTSRSSTGRDCRVIADRCVRPRTVSVIVKFARSSHLLVRTFSPSLQHDTIYGTGTNGRAPRHSQRIFSACLISRYDPSALSKRECTPLLLECWSLRF